ncbi:hypothetical protein BU24DRAFT_472320 [Aaosphaeria arxii CBS 175.79]|uniref:Transcription factor domain-containing protein n=1 Tax=Aaosphaeria arxii CBS 175.79 TaxID=1450172 RepID=A0A6A5XE82_9PLEO|nr:uncharacterized protein BU24DRAFT_472320 [Aaosphaeria arxii CBS 175.79]KAF2011181.1 hypothetical protein BU24DRAFT_472320 [Aaosphaeria arxii CBS 175.79]
MIRPDSGISIGTQNYSSFFEARIRLGFITQKAQSVLHSPIMDIHPRQNLENTIALFRTELGQWARSTFPDGTILHQALVAKSRDTGFLQDHYILAFSYYSAEILISRLCICAFPDTSTDVPDTTWIYRNGPWWCIVYNILQACTAFLLDISNQAIYSRTGSLEDDAASKAYAVMLDMMSVCAPRSEHFADLFKDKQKDPQKPFNTSPQNPSQDLHDPPSMPRYRRMSSHMGNPLFSRQFEPPDTLLYPVQCNQVQEPLYSDLQLSGTFATSANTSRMSANYPLLNQIGSGTSGDWIGDYGLA